ncbi:MAG: SOS response-associated peptidase [Bacteroidetes bacterium]|nr:SOS response-associated peptidase [Bacteroidota bacterium]
MCGRYILVQKPESIEKRFEVKVPEELELKPSYNISPGNFAPVITDDKPNELQLFLFGLTPFWAKKPMYLFNARAEGDRNRENDPNYRGAKDIINKPSFRKPIRSQRCLVIADAFIEGTTNEGLSKPYVVYLRERERPFAFAGIWDKWLNRETGELLNSFSIITTTANSLLQKLPHHRSPVILPRSSERIWLRNSPLTDITSLLRPYNPDKMNAYPVSPAIKNPRAEGAELIKPIGHPVEKELDYTVKSFLQLQGMGSGKNRLLDLNQSSH